MNKHWRTTVTNTDGSHITLFATTTDELVVADLATAHAGSLIRASRHFRSREEPFTDEENHFDLADEAFRGHCHYRQITYSGKPTETTGSPPPRRADSYTGGEPQAPLVPIWEEPVAD